MHNTCCWIFLTMHVYVYAHSLGTMPVSTIPISTYISGYFMLLFCVVVPTGLHLRHPMFAGPELYIMLVICCACVHGALHLHNINTNA